MAFKIDKEQCLGCGACVETCPTTAIAADADKYAIDVDKCTDCGVCSDSCPASCILAGTKV